MFSTCKQFESGEINVVLFFFQTLHRFIDKKYIEQYIYANFLNYFIKVINFREQKGIFKIV